MKKGITFQCLLISPSDTQEHRSLVREAVRRYNGHDLGPRVELLECDPHAYPDLGSGPQGVVNRQLMDQCDFGIALFWTKLGTPTESHPSGSVEEIELLRKRGRPVTILMCEEPLPKDVDLKEVQRLRSQREVYERLGLVREYQPQRLTLEVLTYLPKIVRDLVRKSENESIGTTETPADDSSSLRIELEDELLVLVATFVGKSGMNPTATIVAELERLFHDQVLDFVRIQQISEAPASEDETQDLAEQYGASMIVWGSYTHDALYPRFEVMRDTFLKKRTLAQADRTDLAWIAPIRAPSVALRTMDALAFDGAFQCLALEAVGELCAMNFGFADAIRAYRAALRQLTDVNRQREVGLTRVGVSLASVYFAQQRFDDALGVNAQAIALDPTYIPARLQRITLNSIGTGTYPVEELAELRSMLKERISAAESEIERASLGRLLARIEELQSNADLKKLSGGEELDKLTNLLSQAESGRRLSGQGRQDVAIHLLAAVRHTTNGNFGIARKSLALALQRNPRCSEAFMLLANLEARLDQPEKATTSLERAMRIDRKQPAAYVLKAEISLRYEQDPSAALTHIERALELGLPLSRGIYRWGRCMLELDRAEAVLRRLQKLQAQLDPMAAAMSELRARCATARAQFEIAREAADDAIKADPSDPEAFEARAELYEELGEWELAVADFDQAVEIAKGPALKRIFGARASELRRIAKAAGVANAPTSTLDPERA